MDEKDEEWNAALDAAKAAIDDLYRNSNRILVWCDCAGQVCPQGKIGSQTRCRVWLEREHVSEAGMEWQKTMGTPQKWG